MTFTEFFHDVWGHDPFPWQERVAELALQGNWPESIGLPTAAGKTALIDIAVYALAMRAPKAARRIFFVVDRRVIVDEAADRAHELAERLRSAPAHSPSGVVARALRELGGAEPLATSVLRGGIPRDDGWAESPLQPAVICSTVDQAGSSLLFRAYGSSEYGRSIRAGLASQDALILLDEAHTSRPFAETLRWVSQYRMWAEQPLATPLTVVEMSATPRGDAFREMAGDLNHPLLKQRWEARKKARLAPVDARKDESAARGELSALVNGLVHEAVALRDRHGAKVIGVIANRVRTARQVHDVLKTKGEAILMTGRARPYDRDRLWEKYRDRIALGWKGDPDAAIFVVATQCIEVGANLEFDALVTEIASIDALEQRFGRLDRDGRFARDRESTHAAIVAQADQVAKKFSDRLYGSAMPAAWAWLKEHLSKEVRTEELPAEGKKKPKTRKVKEEFVEMGVLALRGRLAATADRAALATPRQYAPVLMPAHLDLLCQTSPEPPVSPDAAVFLHGAESGPAEVQVVWRADLTQQDIGEDAVERVAMCPPSAAEAISLPLWTVRRWLTSAASADDSDVADVEGLPDEDGRVRGEMRPALLWRGVDESVVVARPGDLRAGATIVVPAEYGGCDRWGWNPESMAPVDDVGDAVKLIMGRPVLRLEEGLARQWKYEGLARAIRSAEETRTIRDALAESGELEVPWVRKTVAELAGPGLRTIGHPSKDEWAALAAKASFDQNDSRSSYGSETPLEDHLRGCANRAKEFARELPETLRNTVVKAAALHDIGKADPRFQAWLRGGNRVKQDQLIAKSKRSAQNRAAMERARRWAGYPKGSRHELMSVRLLEDCRNEWNDLDFDLLLHLIASHHGRCRPFAPVVADTEPVVVRYGAWSASSAHELDKAGSGVCERFWRLTRRYGWYGLAYLEAILRLADHRESEAPAAQEGKAAHA